MSNNKVILEFDEEEYRELVQNLSNIKMCCVAVNSWEQFSDVKQLIASKKWNPLKSLTESYKVINKIIKGRQDNYFKSNPSQL